MNRNSERIFDEYLVASAILGDRVALSRLVHRWHVKLLRHACRLLGNADRAKDVVQEAWIEILRGLARLDDVAAFPAWSYRIVTRRCQRTFGRTAREMPLDDAVQSQPETADRSAGEREAELQTVLATIATLPGAQQATLALFYVEDLTIVEIALAMDVPPGTVKTRLMHARRKVRQALLGEGNEDG